MSILTSISWRKTLVYIVICGLVAAGGFYLGEQSAERAAQAASAKNTTSGSNRLSSSFRGGANSANALTLDGQAITLESLMAHKGKIDADLLAQWAKSLSPEELAAALSSLQGLPAGMPRNAILGAVIDAWATRDPKGFLASSGNLTAPNLREGGVDTALRAWASSDPQAALAWIKQNPGTASNAAQRGRYAAAIAGYAATDPTSAFQTVAALDENNISDTQLKMAALQSLTNALADEGKFSDAAQMFSSLPAGRMQNMAYLNLAQQWVQSAPQDASAWVSSLTDPNMRSQLGTRIASSWAATDPTSAAAWAVQMDQQSASAAGNNTNGNGPNQPPGSTLASVMSSWSQYDLDGPAQFLNNMQASSTKDSAVAVFAMAAGQENPQDAVPWVSSIGDDALRQRMAAVVALQMLGQDPNTYNQFMSSTNLLTDQQKQMLNNLPPQMANRFSNALNGGGGLGGGGFGGGGGGGFGGGGGGGGPGGGGGGFAQRIQNMVLNGNGPFGQFTNPQGGQQGGPGGGPGGFGGGRGGGGGFGGGGGGGGPGGG
jgi:hypothetical protein